MSFEAYPNTRLNLSITCESDKVTSQLRGSGTHTSALLSMHGSVKIAKLCMCRFIFSDLDVGACIFQENMSIETLNISFESTRNKQQYGTKITCTEVRGKKLR